MRKYFFGLVLFFLILLPSRIGLKADQEADYPVEGLVTVDNRLYAEIPVTAYLQENSNIRYSTTTDHEGVYRFTLPEGFYRFYAEPSCRDSQGSPIGAADVSAGNSIGPTLWLVCKRYTVSGNVTIDGSPAFDGVTVTSWAGTPPSWNQSMVFGGNGNYVLKDIPSGNYTFKAKHPCTGAEISVNVDADKSGQDINLTCKNGIFQDPVADTRTCQQIVEGVAEMRSGLDASLDQAIYLPLIMVNQDHYKMSQSEFLELSRQFYEMSSFITEASDRQAFNSRDARASGYSEKIIGLTHNIILFQNTMFLQNAGREVLEANDDKLSAFAIEFMRVAGEYNSSLVTSAEGGSVVESPRKASDTGREIECTCGTWEYPRPNVAAGNQGLASGLADYVTAQAWVAKEKSDFYIPFLDWMGDNSIGVDWGYVKPYSWTPDACGTNTFQDNIHIVGLPDEDYEVVIQSYEGQSPRGEPSVDVKLDGGPLNWPYWNWPTYVLWWHQCGPGGDTLIGSKFCSLLTP